MTDITVESSSYTAENRSWLAGPHGTEPGAMPSVQLDLSTFDHANFSTGIVKSGCVLGKITASGKYGPYEPAASDGREVAVGLLFNTFDKTGKTQRADAVLIHGFVTSSKLPYASGDGLLDAAAIVDLKHVVVL